MTVTSKLVSLREERMKLLTILLAPIVAAGMGSTVLARDDKDFVAEGYRWVSIDGPYACPTKEDRRRINRDASDINELHMVEQVRAFFLIQGAGLIPADTSAEMGAVQGQSVQATAIIPPDMESKKPIVPSE